MVASTRILRWPSRYRNLYSSQISITPNSTTPKTLYKTARNFRKWKENIYYRNSTYHRFPPLFLSLLNLKPIQHPTSEPTNLISYTQDTKSPSYKAHRSRGWFLWLLTIYKFTSSNPLYQEQCNKLPPISTKLYPFLSLSLAFFFSILRSLWFPQVNSGRWFSTLSYTSQFPACLSSHSINLSSSITNAQHKSYHPQKSRIRIKIPNISPCNFPLQ
jgi:hypothetical protein